MRLQNGLGVKSIFSFFLFFIFYFLFSLYVNKFFFGFDFWDGFRQSFYYVTSAPFLLLLYGIYFYYWFLVGRGRTLFYYVNCFFQVLILCVLLFCFDAGRGLVLSLKMSFLFFLFLLALYLRCKDFLVFIGCYYHEKNYENYSYFFNVYPVESGDLKRLDFFMFFSYLILFVFEFFLIKYF